MNITPETVAYAQRDYIYNLFKSQVNVDNNGIPGNGPNTGGTLQKVASLGRKSIWPSFTLLPFVGVQLLEQKEALSASGRKHEITTDFHVGVSVKVLGTAEEILQVDDALDELETLCDDGAGNGVCPILRANSAYNLGSLIDPSGVTRLNAEMNYLPSIKYAWDERPSSKGVSYFAYAIISVSGVIHLNVGH